MDYMEIIPIAYTNNLWTIWKSYLLITLIFLRVLIVKLGSNPFSFSSHLFKQGLQHSYFSLGFQQI